MKKSNSKTPAVDITTTKFANQFIGKGSTVLYNGHMNGVLAKVVRVVSEKDIIISFDKDFKVAKEKVSIRQVALCDNTGVGGALKKKIDIYTDAIRLYNRSCRINQYDM